jgi:hypothetical protein
MTSRRMTDSTSRNIVRGLSEEHVCGILTPLKLQLSARLQLLVPHWLRGAQRCRHSPEDLKPQRLSYVSFLSRKGRTT